MSTYQANFAPDVTTFTTFCRWATIIPKALAQFGWIQNLDTGQVVWPATVIAITACASTGGVSTYTYTTPVGFGNALVVGSRVVIAGMTNAGNNGTFVIVALPLATTFTVANGAPGADEAGSTGRGTVDTTVHITNAVGDGVHVTYTYSQLSSQFQGPFAVHVGQSIIITGCTTGGANGTFVITSTPDATSFAAVNNTAVSEAEPAAAIGAVAAQNALPGASSTVFEIWKMNDVNQATSPVYIKLIQGETAATVSPSIQIIIGRGTDGAGIVNLAASSTLAIRTVASSNSATASQSDLSGDTNRFQFVMWHVGGAQSGQGFCLERSHDSGGNDTTEYITYIVLGTTGALVVGQSSLLLTTTSWSNNETRIVTACTNSTLTGTYGNSTAVFPAFPIVGAVGNPLLGLIVGNKVDFTDNTLVSMTLYGQSHSYLIVNNTTWAAANVLVYPTAATDAWMIRNE